MDRHTAYAWELPVAATGKAFLLDYTYEELEALLRDWGFKAANARDIYTGIARKGYRDYGEFPANVLPRSLVHRLREPAAPAIDPFETVQAFPSHDGSVKYLYRLKRGGQVESVYMPARNRRTLCISSQVGCALGCTFCATGAMGFKRDLTPAEMVGQVMQMLACHPNPPGRTVRANVVFMGMGEPLHNFDNVMTSFDILTHPHGLVISQRDVAVSTSGLVPKIRRMADRKRRPQLMVSIAATTDEARSSIMPVNRAYGLEELIHCLEEYPIRKRETIMLSYVLIAGVNDSAADADRLAAMSRRFTTLINLIPMNEHEASPGMEEPSEERLQWFYRRLVAQGAFSTVRRSRGRDVGGACGQLSATPV